MAERGWSPKTTTSIGDFRRRATAFRCELNRRGIEAQPIAMGGRFYHENGTMCQTSTAGNRVIAPPAADGCLPRFSFCPQLPVLKHDDQPMQSGATPNATLYLSANNVKGEVTLPTVHLLGVVRTLAACEALCFEQNAKCETFTWHHTDYSKKAYAGHCYGRSDGVWAPVAQSKIDSGCRTDVRNNASRCARGPRPPGPPPPPPPPFRCASDFNCAGSNGNCDATTGHCSCKAGWSGDKCGLLKFKPASGRVAYPTELWTWGGSPIVDDAGTFHLFSSEISENCGILHYCINSRVIHLTSPNATGPYTRREVALGPRADAWDNGAVHGISVHRLPNKTYALFYMGSADPWAKGAPKVHPNCTVGSGDTKANITTGSHNGRRIGIALSESLAVGAAWRR